MHKTQKNRTFHINTFKMTWWDSVWYRPTSETVVVWSASSSLDAAACAVTVELLAMPCLFLVSGLRVNAAMRLVCPTPSVTSRHFLDVIGDFPLRRTCPFTHTTATSWSDAYVITSVFFVNATNEHRVKKYIETRKHKTQHSNIKIQDEGYRTLKQNHFRNNGNL